LPKSWPKDLKAVSDKSIISVENISFSYNSSPVLIDVNFTVEEKDIIWIVGPNGGGKTTLLKLILGLLSPKRGKIKIFDKAPAEVRSRLGYMPQVANLDPKFPVNALDIALMGRLGNGTGFGPFRERDYEAAEKALRETGLYDLRFRPFSELSGGEQRRLLIARAIAGEPDILLLDEPTANLDLVVEKEFFKILKNLNERLTIIMVSHEPAFVLEFVKRVICVNRKVSEHPTCEIDGQFMGDLYGGQLRMVRHDQHVEKKESHG
jgi:zinc transport system ATP-binding protein